MGTNGGCHCVPPLGQRLDMDERTRLRLAILWMREEIERLDTALRRKEDK
jgi:selenocysteine lyase/cysteine desulfurase